MNQPMLEAATCGIPFRGITGVSVLLIFLMDFFLPGAPWRAPAAARVSRKSASASLSVDTAQLVSHKPAEETRFERIEKGADLPADIDDEDMSGSMKAELGIQPMFRPAIYSRLPTNAVRRGSASNLHGMRKETGDLSPPAPTSTTIALPATTRGLSVRSTSRFIDNLAPSNSHRQDLQ